MSTYEEFSPPEIATTLAREQAVAALRGGAQDLRYEHRVADECSQTGLFSNWLKVE